MTDNELIQITKLKVKAEKKLTAEIISYLEEINNRRLYVEYKCDSLFKFCVRILKYSQGEASLRVKAVRVAKRLPEIKDKLETSKVSLSSLATLESFLANNPKKNPKEMLDLIEGKSARETQNILNTQDQNPKPREVKLVLKEHLLKKLAKVQKELGDVNEYEALEILIDEKLAQISSSKTKRIERGSKSQRYIPRSVKERVPLQKCEGCGGGRNLQRDHIRPIALGGKSEVSNLRVLCFSCNQRSWIKHSDTHSMKRLIIEKSRSCDCKEERI